MVFFWLLMFATIGGLLYYTLILFVPKNESDRKIQRAALYFAGILTLITLTAMLRFYSADREESLVINQDMSIEQRTLIARTAVHLTHHNFEILANDPEKTVRYQLTVRRDLPENIVTLLLADKDPSIRKRMVRNLAASKDDLQNRLQVEQDHSVIETIKAAIQLRDAPNSPAYKQAAEGTIQDPALRLTEALEQISADSELAVKIRKATASNPMFYSVDSMAADENADVRYAVASNPAASTLVLITLLSDKDTGVQQMAAMTLSEKPDAEMDTLETFSHHSNPYIRIAVAKNPNAPTYVLDTLSKDADSRVLQQVASNPHSSSHGLEILAKQDDIEIRRRVARQPQANQSTLAELAEDKDIEVRRRVASNEHTLVDTLEALSEDKSAVVREAVANNPRAPLEVLMKLAKNPTPSVRAAVAINRAASVEIIKRLASDEDPNVRNAANHNLRHFKETLENLGEDSNVFLRRQVAQNPDTPGKTLEKLAEDQDVYVRERVALNPNTPATIVQQLLNDPEEQVRLAAQENEQTKNE